MNNTAIKSNIEQGISYEGKVKITVTSDNKILGTTVLHNSGRAPLFKFFTSCLGNEWAAAQHQCPCRIVLFKKGNSEELGVFNKNYWTNQYAITPNNGILYNIPPVQVISDEENSSSIKYHFRVPTSLLSSSGSSIAKLGLYSNLVTLVDPAAYVFLDSTATELLKTASGNPNLLILIDWVLTISNKTSNSNVA